MAESFLLFFIRRNILEGYFTSPAFIATMQLIATLFRYLLSLRYRIKIEGKELLDKQHTFLLLPSHVALVDPLILTAFLAPYLRLSPLASRKYFDKWWLRPFFKLLKAIPVEEFNRDKGSAQDAQQAIQEVHHALTQQQNILLYPQGELAAQGYQSILGKKSAYFVVKELPAGVKICTVKIRGLRGSRSSRAWTGQSPRLFSFLLRGALSLLANAFVFTPKREVLISIQEQTAPLKKVLKQGMQAFNSNLEKIYNAEGEEPIQYLSALSRYNTVKDRTPPKQIIGSLQELQQQRDYSSLSYPPEVLDQIIQSIRKIKEDPNLPVKINDNLVLELFFDSLDLVELKNAISSKFPNASHPPLLSLKTVGDLVMMAMGKSPLQEGFKPCVWQSHASAALVKTTLAHTITSESTILSVMKQSFKRLKNASIAYDQLFGVQSARDFLIKAYVIAGILRQFPEKRIGIMLPSLSATSLLIIACYLVQKVPVMLNWTQSKEGFAHCLKVQEVQHILTAKSFFQKVQTPRLQSYEMTYFEELLKKVSLTAKLKAVYQAFRFQIPKTLEETAVVLFTSGSESLPKAVALTHQNILSNLLGALERVKIKEKDILLAFLPPFHSFGFTVNTILPLLAGVRTVYSPDPTDASTLVNLLEHTQATLITSTPTFFHQILKAARPDQLKSLRMVVTGAEKASLELMNLFHEKTKKTEFLEGYGITECSPIISAGQKPGSVGLPIGGVEILIIDQETQQICKPGERGMIYVSGPSVFPGYLDPTLASPFEVREGKKWYITGDLGYQDAEGYLYLSGRLKRFVKIAGEMISLPAIEELLQKQYTNPLCQLALEAKEFPDGKVKFVVFSTQSLAINDLNTFLHKQGITNLVKISELQVLAEIPLL